MSIMKVGDLVKNLNSESRMLGIIIRWFEEPGRRVPVVLWADGRCNWIVQHRVEVVNESR